MRGILRLWWALRTTTRNLWNGRISAIVAATSIALTLVLTTVSLLLGSQTERLRDHWTGRADIAVYLCTRASISANCRGATTTAQIEEQEVVIASHSGVEAYWFEDRAAAWAAFTERFADSSILANLDANALPESYRIKLADGVDREHFLGDIERTLGDIGGFDVVQDQRETLSGFFSVTEKIRVGALGLAALQSSISVALMAHLLRSSIAKRRKDIRVMGLVGTPRRQIRAPFVLEALTVYTAGMGVAAVVVVTGLDIARRFLAQAGGSEALLVGTGAAVQRMLAIYLAGLVVGWVTVRLTLRARLRDAV